MGHFQDWINKVQMDLLHTFRQADKADGSKVIRQNAKMIKEMHTEISAKMKLREYMRFILEITICRHRGYNRRNAGKNQCCSYG